METRFDGHWFVRMGKNLQNQDAGISLESNNPGCIKGLFHRFSNRRWNNVKRRLPYRRNSTGKLPAGRTYCYVGFFFFFNAQFSSLLVI